MLVLRIVGIPHIGATTGTWVRCLYTDVLGLLRVNVAVNGIDALLLLMQLHALRTALLIGSILQQKQPSPNGNSPAAGRGTRTPVAPLAGGTLRIRKLHLLVCTVRPHALVLFHYGDMGTSLASQMIDKGARAHGNANATAGRTLGPHAPGRSFAETGSSPLLPTRDCELARFSPSSSSRSLDWAGPSAHSGMAATHISLATSWRAHLF